MSVQIIRSGYEKLHHDYKQFPGGEPHVVIDKIIGTRDNYTLKAKIRSFDDLGELLAVTDALKRSVNSSLIDLRLPYFPGARQDRRFPNGAFTLKIYTDIINSQKYDKVTILDPHSDVTPALLDNVEVETAAYYSALFAARKAGPVSGLIAPDAGALKRTEAVAKSSEFKSWYGVVPVLQATKERNESTGRIERFSLPPLPEVGRYLVVDDICDGGSTFDLLGKAFHAQSLNLGSWAGVSVRPTVDLWVTHGIFSDGALDKLFVHYDSIGTTDSIFRPSEEEWKAYKTRLFVAEV